MNNNIQIMYKFSKQQNLKIDEAIKLVSHRIKRADKPVLFHSLKITFYLLSKGYSGEIITASILHDLIEDSDFSAKDIKKKFGKEVYRLVQAVSYNSKIKDSVQRYHEMFARTNSTGPKALIIKAADIYDNSHFYYQVKNKVERTKLLNKVDYFLNISKPKIGSTEVWQDLNNQYHQLKKIL